MSYTVSQIAKELSGEVVGDGDLVLAGIAPADSAKGGDLTFADQESYLAAALAGEASAILVPAALAPGTEGRGKTLIRVKDARIAVARALALFFPPPAYPPGVAPGVFFDTTSEIDPSAHVGPHCVIGAGVRIGARAVLMGGNHIGAGSRIGDDTVLHPNVVVYPGSRIGNRVAIHAGTAIGSDGYGYVLDQGKHRKVPQIGTIVIEDDVEIGANAALDRGALGATVIGQGTKIDNLVHLAHNVVVGKHCLLLGQVGIAGSTKMGDYVVIASQSGISGHLKIGNQALVGAKSGVMRDIPDGGRVLGHPAVSDIQAKRQWVATAQLPETVRRVKALEKRVGEGDSPAGE
ncbi:UDP-3-O-[3-hydroxymyristoyl] glucosamine N-acyltransferase [Verrucomicrobium sp. GAS474]|uniref:UDP-3-O-(3-hydroxymyristoyl)glucosamine N-acyltransferase n=1 Tax=Verrucomicrobium sp. GAS474 TaxID=1882831 RepID=UPI00087D0785|nr:UDP-3-O-(3-hydroxymyristoyl)glucosamine N-acyltransferase [Verrucomicrobium sp. GAS474]SDU05655.1 UDP-3-O-[3-hydroxymyristoyl] glucosamine N-acyltransferase [Verrucomicrobium sp. GAS474]